MDGDRNRMKIQSKYNTHGFDPVALHPVYKYIRAISLNRTKESINTTLTAKRHIWLPAPTVQKPLTMSTSTRPVLPSSESSRGPSSLSSTGISPLNQSICATFAAIPISLLISLDLCALLA
nr:hypothetical protein Iba_chr11eCG1540 [Ipomoea batatas]